MGRSWMGGEGRGLRLDLAAGALDSCACALGDVHALDGYSAGNGAGRDDARPLGLLMNQIRGLQRREIDEVALDFCKLRQAHFSNLWRNFRAEAHFRQTALQRHLAAFEADLVIAALARALALDAAAAGLALAGGRAAPDAQANLLAARSRRNAVQTHVRLPQPSTGARRRGSCRAPRAYRRASQYRGCDAGRARAPWRGAASAVRKRSSRASP